MLVTHTMGDATGERGIMRAENLWWPFGAHIWHVALAKIHARRRGLRLYYRRNDCALFPRGEVEHYFEPFGDVTDAEVEAAAASGTLVHHLADDNIARGYVPDGYGDIRAYHAEVLRSVFRPSPRIAALLSEHRFLAAVRALGGRYIAMHIRWGDKVAGASRETEMVDVGVYLDLCAAGRARSGVNALVVCADTVDGVDAVVRRNAEGGYGFDVVFDAEETRPENDWTKSFVERVRHRDPALTPERMELEYLTCFSIMHILIECEALVGNYDSLMCMIPAKIRNRPDRDACVTGRAGRWDNA